MPPSIIPPTQLRSMMADLEGEQPYGAPVRFERSPGYVQPRRRASGAFAWIMVGAVLGVGVGFLGPRVEGLISPPPPVVLPQPTALAITPTPAPVAAPPPAEIPVPPASAEPAPPMRATVLPTAAPSMRATVTPAPAPQKKAEAARPLSCVKGGPCGRSDVQAAERRLRSAYESAKRAGVSNMVLGSYRQRWEHASGSARSRPRTTVGAYRTLANELNVKAAQARARRH